MITSDIYAPLTPIEFDTPDFIRRRTDYITRYTLTRTQTMFAYENLPDDLDARHIELLLQVHGDVCITKVNEKLYAFYGGLGGEPDAYYEPTIYTVSNPALGFSANLEIGSECVRGRSDSLSVGLLPLIRYYASMIANNEQTMFLADINARIESIITADNDATYKSARGFIDDVKDGKISPIMGSSFFEGLKVAPFSGQSTPKIKSLIELEQYLRANLLNEIGINANYNMKRERLEDSEAGLNDSALIPFIEDMLNNRVKMCEEINALYGTDITVKLSGVWEREERKQEMALEEPEEEITEEPEEEITEEPEEEITEEITEEPEEEITEEITEEPEEEITEEIKEDIEEIKEDIEEIKEEVIEDEENAVN